MEENTDKRTLLKELGFSDKYLDILEEYERNHNEQAIETPDFESLIFKPTNVENMQFESSPKDLSRFNLQVKDNKLFYVSNPTHQENE